MYRQGGGGGKPAWRSTFGDFWSVAAANAVLWAVFLGLTARYPFLLSLGVLAWGFGLRHAVDADHLAAIDNATRKFIQDGRPSTKVGLFFSLGHSTVVFLLALAIAAGAAAARGGLPGLERVGAIAGSAVSALFLLLIAGLNGLILRQVYGTYRELVRRRRSGSRQTDGLEASLALNGLMGRVFGRFYRALRSQWQMYPIGVLFGLGFDTATEVALLAMSALAVGHGMPVATVLILPALFAAGMSLVDTLDGALMQRAYGWAVRSPLRRVYYNLVITGASVAIALAIGGLEALQAVAAAFSLHGTLWRSVEGLNPVAMGGVVAAALLLGGLLALALQRGRTWDGVGVHEDE